jgi:amidase
MGIGADLAGLDAVAQADLVRRHEVSALELVDAAIANIERLDGGLNAVVHRRFDKARAEAMAPKGGAFAGLPFLVKDLVAHSDGDPFHEGIRGVAKQGYRARADTALIRRFREAGLICVGRTNTPELGLVPTTEPALYGPTRNPWDVTRSPGGSSGGSAAAVAARMVPVAHGNDGGGSIRIPASCCALVGLKPTRGRVSLAPDFGDVAGGIVHEHVLTRSVRDTAALLDCVAGPEPGEPYSAPAPARAFADEVGCDPDRHRIGLMTAAPGGFTDVHEECRAAVMETGRLLTDCGHEVDRAHPRALDEDGFAHHFGVLFQVFAHFALGWWQRETGRPLGREDVEPLTWALVEAATRIAAADYLASLEWLQAYSRRVATWWAGGFDLLVTPTLPHPPLPLGSYPADDLRRAAVAAIKTVTFTAPFNVTGQPAISLPLHWTADGLPVGVQIVAAYGREDVLLRIASQIELVRPWAGRRPPICG